MFTYRATILLSLFSASLFGQVPGSILTIAGTGTAGFSGDGGAATQAALNVPVDVSADRSGNIFIADQFNSRIRKISSNGVISTVAGTGVPGFSGDGGSATSAQINTPTGVFVDSAGNLYISDTGNQRIRKVDTSGIISTIAGNGSKAFSGDGGPATSASLYNPVRVAVDASGNVLIADQSNHRIRRVTPGGVISTIAGNGAGTPANGAFGGDGGPATAASFNNPTALAVTAGGVIYVSDQFNQRIRKIAVDGTITTIAGNGGGGFSGDGGQASATTLNYPGGITVDGAGNIYFSDDVSYRVRRIAPSGVITTVAGNGAAGFSGDSGVAAAASLNGNFGVAIDFAGNLLIADSVNNRIREVFGTAATSSSPTITQGGIVPIYSSSSTIQPGSWVSIFGTNLSNTTAVWNSDFPTLLGGTTVKINNKPAYLWYVSPTQINLQAPDDQFTGMVNVVVTTANGGTTSTVNLGLVAPSLSLLDGRHAAGVILRSDGSGAYGGGSYDIIGPTGTSLGYKTVAARAGDSVVLFGVGFGATNPVVPAGQLFSGSARTTNTVLFQVGNNSAWMPTFSGLTSAGLYQFNLIVPSALGAGDVSLRATVNGVQTPTGVVISLQ